MYNKQALLRTLIWLETGSSEPWHHQRLSANDRLFVIAYSLGAYREPLERLGVVRRTSIGELKTEGVDLTSHFVPRFNGRPVSDVHTVYEVDVEKVKGVRKAVDMQSGAYGTYRLISPKS